MPGDADFNPIADLPKPFRKTVAYLWAYYADILPNPTAFAVRVKTWIAKDGLTPEDVQKAASELCSPEAAAEIQFANQFHVHFARLIGNSLRLRRIEREMIERRGQPPLADSKAAEQISIAEAMKRRIAEKGTE